MTKPKTAAEPCPAVAQILEQRQRRAASPDVETLLDRLAQRDLAALLYALTEEDTFRDLARVGDWLRARLDSLDLEGASQLALLLAERLPSEAYATLMTRVLGAADPMNATVRAFIQYLRGSDAFNHALQAEEQVPRSLRAGRSIALELVLAHLHRDDAARPAWLVTRAREDSASRFFIWHVAVAAGHDDAAEESLGLLDVRPLLPSAHGTVDSWNDRRFQWQAIIPFIARGARPSPRARCLGRVAHAAISSGSSLRDLAALWRAAGAPDWLLEQLHVEVAR
jgi:hypothetical protein